MSVNKQTTALATTAAVISVLLISILMPSTTVHAADYDYNACLAKWAKVKNVDKLRDKAINPAIDNRLGYIDKLKSKLDKVMPENAEAITRGLNTDTAILKDIKRQAASSNSPTRLQEHYCHVLFEVQIYTLRAKQVSYLRYTDSRHKRAVALQKVLTNDRNSNVKNIALKAAVDARLNEARAAISTVVAETKAGSESVLAAKVDTANGYSTSSLVKPAYNGHNIDALYQTAYQKYTEANVLRKASSHVSKNVKTKDRANFKVESVTLKDESGNDASKDAKKATRATIKYSNPAGGLTGAELKRADAKSAWVEVSFSGGGEG